jgi:hypothetical protein
VICRVLYIGFSGLPIRSNGKFDEVISMTQLEVAYRYAGTLNESNMRALDGVREVYGIRRISFSPKDRVVRIEFDASRLKEPTVAALLRGAGVDVREKLVLA